MVKLTQMEIGLFLKLFNRGGYVLNFSTSDFDVFTCESIGECLCAKYELSKGKSLIAYLDDASDDNKIKLLKDLFEYYEQNYENEYAAEDGDSALFYNKISYKKLYTKCKVIADKVFSNVSFFQKSAQDLKTKFSSEYLNSQIELMIAAQSTNPTEAIGKAKEIVESCCKTILEDNQVGIKKEWDVGELSKETFKLLKLMPSDIPDTATAATEMKSLLGNLRSIAANLAALRNPYGSGHGKSANYKGLEERHAKLAVGSSIALVTFLWDTHEARGKLR